MHVQNMHRELEFGLSSDSRNVVVGMTRSGRFKDRDVKVSRLLRKGHTQPEQKQQRGSGARHSVHLRKPSYSRKNYVAFDIDV